MHDRAYIVVKDGVVLVLPILSKTAIAALAQAMELVAAEVPAAWALQQIPADRRHIANLWRRRLQGCVRQRGITLTDQRMLGDRRQCRHRSDAQPPRLFLDIIQSGDNANVDQPRGRVEAFLQAVHQIDTTGFDDSLVTKLADGIVDRAGVRPFKAGNHAPPPCFTLPSAESTRAGVRGSSNIRMPMALYTALATAAAVGIFAGSPMPPASVELRA